MPSGFGLDTCLNVAVGEYDFTKDGGGIGTINLRGDVIPRDALIVKVLIFGDVAVTAGGAATIALNAEAAADLLAAAAYTGFSQNSVQDGIPSMAAANVKRTTDNRPIQATIAAYALTGGKFRVFAFWVNCRP